MKALLLIPFLFITEYSAAQSDEVTFNVDNVQVTNYPLQDTSFQIILENKIQKKLFAFPEELKSVEVVPAYMNGFLYAIHTAYADHRPLVLSPDDVWLIICQGFGHHMILHADSLEESVLQPDRPDELVIRNDGLSYNNPDAWKELINSFSKGIQNHAKDDILNLISQKFTTTTPVIQTAYQATLMDGMKRYFSYKGESGCGIPSVTLSGTPEDWEKVAKDFENFRKYGLEEWVDALGPVLKEFHKASLGNPNTEYWKSMYKDVTMYGTSTITGWILKFFPYLNYTITVGEESWEHENEYIKTYRKNPYLNGEDYLLSQISSNAIPKGYVDLDFIWNEYSPEGALTEHKMKLYAGFFGVRQNCETKAVRPNIAWAVCEKDSILKKHIRWGNARDWTRTEDFEHRQDGWVARIWDDTSDYNILPVYNPEKNTSYESGIDEFKRELKKSNVFKGKQVTLTFIIAWNGKIFLDSVAGNDIDNDKIEQVINNLKHTWSPAKIRAFMIDDEGDLPANFRLSITI